MASPPLTRRAILTGLTLASLWPRALFAQAAPGSGPGTGRPGLGDFEATGIGAADRAPGGGILYGWDSDCRGPETADFHVAPAGDDGGPGTVARPFRTIARGVAALAERPEGSLALAEGLYREAVSLDALRGRPRPDGQPAYRIHRRGADRVTLTAAEPLTGWQPCPPEEAAALGQAGQPLFVTELALARIAHGAPAALNLHEAGVWSPLASLSGEGASPRGLFDKTSYRPARFEVAGKEQFITGLRDAALEGHDPALLQDSEIFVYHHGNHISPITATGYDPARGALQFAGQAKLRAHKSNQSLYRVQNFAPAAQTGQWFYRRRGGVLRIYLLPRHPERIETAVEVSLRDHCIEFGAASSLELYGLEAVRAAGARGAAGCCIRRSARPAAEGRSGHDLRLLQCRAAESQTALGRGYGAIFLQGAVDLQIRRCTVETCRGGFGLFLNRCREADLRYLYLHDISNSPARFFGLEGGIFAFSLLRSCGWDVHANKFNFYLGSDRVLVYGIRSQNTRGYATYQSASRIHFGFCELDGAAAANNRVLVSQNYAPGRGKGGPDGSGDPVPESLFCFWNLTLLPDAKDSREANALSLGPAETRHRFEVHNSVLHGGGFAAAYQKGAARDRERRSHNRYTGQAFWQSPRYGWSLGEGEARQPPFTPPLGRGRDLRALIARELAPLFPGFTAWDCDIDGRRIDWADAPIGASLRG